METKVTNNRATVIKSIIYKFLERCGTRGIAFVVQIVLARLLDPTDYGVLSLLTIFINLSQVFVQSGFNKALVQRNDVTEKDYSSVFYISLGVACVMYGVLFFSAPFISDFYNMPQLTSVLRVLAIILIPGAFNSIQNAKIMKEMQFKQLMHCTLISVVISGVVGIVMAYYGFGVWALVGQQISNQVSICLIMLVVVKWRPRLVFEISRVKVLFSFGWKILCSNLIDTIYSELQSLVIGKKYDSGTLGYCNRGKQFPGLLVSSINAAIQSVMLPTLSREQDDKVRMKAMMRRSIVTSSFIIFPIMTGLAVVAEPMISLLLTDKWLPCVPYLRIYCIIFAFYPVHISNLQALNALGRSDQYLKLEVIKKIYGIIILVITTFCFHTPLAIAMGEVVGALISCFVNASPNKKLLNYGYAEQLKDILPSFLLAAVMGLVVYCITFLHLSSLLTLIIQIVLGVVFYFGFAWIFKFECFMYLKKMVFGFLKKKR